jgi:hypothetical protein
VTSLSDWLGTSGGTGCGHGLDGPISTPYPRTGSPGRRPGVAGRAADDQLERVTGSQDGIGEGTSERGAVTVRVDAQHRVVDILLTPKAIHLGSTDRLRTALLDAVDAACADITGRLTKASGTGARFSPLDAFIEAIPEVSAVLPQQLRNPPPRPRPPAPGDRDSPDDEETAE